MSLSMLYDVVKMRDIKKFCPLCGRSFAKVKATEEHIFPKWLQHQHDLWNQTLTLPNHITRQYKKIKVCLCARCNNKRFGALEGRISRLAAAKDSFAAFGLISDEAVALWLGKIFWLLCRKSHASVDPKTLSSPEPDTVISNEMIRGTSYLGMVERTFAMKRGMYACFKGDLPIPEFFYGAPYSLYRFRIYTGDKRVQLFDFKDNVVTLGVALRTGSFGVVCVFDGGLHRMYRSHWLEFMADQSLHPYQFNEVAGRIFYDQTVLDPEANEVQYFWNRPLRSVVAMTMTRRKYNPYLQENHDVNKCAFFLSRFIGAEPEKLISKDGKDVVSGLMTRMGRFRRYRGEPTKNASK